LFRQETSRVYRATHYSPCEPSRNCQKPHRAKTHDDDRVPGGPSFLFFPAERRRAWQCLHHPRYSLAISTTLRCILFLTLQNELRSSGLAIQGCITCAHHHHIPILPTATDMLESANTKAINMSLESATICVADAGEFVTSTDVLQPLAKSNKSSSSMPPLPR